MVQVPRPGPVLSSIFAFITIAIAMPVPRGGAPGDGIYKDLGPGLKDPYPGKDPKGGYWVKAFPLDNCWGDPISTEYITYDDHEEQNRNGVCQRFPTKAEVHSVAYRSDGHGQGENKDKSFWQFSIHKDDDCPLNSGETVEPPLLGKWDCNKFDGSSYNPGRNHTEGTLTVYRSYSVRMTGY